MTKAILLTPNGLGNNVSKWIYLVVGMAFTFNGIINLANTPLTNLRLAAGILLLISGILFAILGLITFTRNNYVPRVEIDQERILIRRDIFSTTKYLMWNQIVEIEYKAYALDFQLNNKTNLLIILPTNAKTVLEIKNALREMAESKSIMITNG